MIQNKAFASLWEFSNKTNLLYYSLQCYFHDCKSILDILWNGFGAQIFHTILKNNLPSQPISHSLICLLLYPWLGTWCPLLLECPLFLFLPNGSLPVKTDHCSFKSVPSLLKYSLSTLPFLILLYPWISLNAIHLQVLHLGK